MVLDRENYVYKEILLYTENCFRQYFNNKIRMIDEQYNNSSAGMGAFFIKYEYLFKEYNIVFEYQNLYFNIDIFNKNGAKISLAEICIKIMESQFGYKWADWSLEENNIQKAIIVLASIIDSDNLYFYSYTNGIVFREMNGKISRIKDLSTLNLNMK